MEWASFQDVCEAFDTERLERIERGAGNLEAHAAQGRNKDRHQFLAVWPAPASEIDPIALGLGSWAFDGGLPPYVIRTVDSELARLIKVPGITTVTGAPKSGKSRSVLETLQRNHPDALVWWVNPSPTVLPLVVENAKKTRETERPVFIVLDDAGLIGPDPSSGLTAQRLCDLADTCTHLIVVIHTQTLADWEHQLISRRTALYAGTLGASRELMNQLGRRVPYGSVLDDKETAPAAVTYDNADKRVQSFDLTRLAETLSGVETLRSEATHLLENPVSVEAALLEAAIDASIVYSAGCTVEVLEALAAAHQKRRQPNRPWRPEQLIDAMDKLTSGITVGSPHAILVAGDHDAYRLFDALIPELQHPERDIVASLGVLMGADLPESAVHKAVSGTSRWYALQGFFDKARQVQLYAANHGHTASMHALAVYAEASGDLQAARSWLERAAEAGDADAMFARGNLANDVGATEEATTWWQRAAEAGQAGAMTRLEFSWEEFQRARPIWEREADKGASAAMLNLGMVADHEGDMASAKMWWEKAAIEGNARGLLHLGDLAHTEDDMASAKMWWEKAAAEGVADALVSLGALADREGDIASARVWWEKAAERSEPQALFSLGVLAWREGDVSTAKLWWEKAAALGMANALSNLGVLAHDSGDFKSACAWWEKAFAEGDAQAAAALAETHAEIGNHSEAERWRAYVAEKTDEIDNE
jgi:TPR repeat protein